MAVPLDQIIVDELADLRDRMQRELAGFRGRLLNKATMISLKAGATTALRRWLDENNFAEADWCMRAFGAGDVVPDHFGWRGGGIVGQGGMLLEKEGAIVLLCRGHDDVHVTVDAMPAYLRTPIASGRDTLSLLKKHSAPDMDFPVDWSGMGADAESPPPDPGELSAAMDEAEAAIDEAFDL